MGEPMRVRQEQSCHCPAVYVISVNGRDIAWGRTEALARAYASDAVTIPPHPARGPDSVMT